ncbi:hypothetical protein HLBS07_37100 [Vibrio alginolyticus]|nr:hypothetical protein HLBS07_37100 [Vibrio alginolyticus]
MNIANSIRTQFNLLHGLPYKCWIIYQTDIHYIDNLFMIAVDIKHYSLALNLSVTFRLGTHNYDNGVGREKTTIGYSSGRSSRGRWLPVPKQYYRE